MAELELDLNVKHRVTRFDFYDAVLTALMDTHPKIKNHPSIKDFKRRAEACEQELKRKASRKMIDFGRATEIAIDFLREHGHPRPKLDTTIPSKGWWDFLFDVGVVSKKILVVRVNKEGKITRLEPMTEKAR